MPVHRCARTKLDELELKIVRELNEEIITVVEDGDGAFVVITKSLGTVTR